MSEKKTTNELISALMDNELSEHELLRLLRDVETDSDARQAWSRYQMVSSSIKGDTPVAPQWDISSQVSQALADEPEMSTNTSLAGSKEKEKPTFMSGVARFAVAASVTFAAIFGITQNSYVMNDGAPGGAQIASNAAEVPSLSNTTVQPVSQPVYQQPVGFNISPIQTATVSTGNSKKVLSRPVEANRSVVVRPGISDMEREAFNLRLNEYMLKHAEHASLNSGRGLMPFARIVHEEK